METSRPRILVPLDGSSTARRTLPLAGRLARQLGAEVILLRVIPPRVPPNDYPADLLAPTDRAEQWADAELQADAAALPGVPIRRVVLVGTKPDAEIVSWLQLEPVDLVVMVTRELGRIRSLITGSVTEAVIQSGLAPVIAVPADSGVARRDPTPREAVLAA